MARTPVPTITESVAEALDASLRRRRSETRRQPLDAKIALAEHVLPALRSGRLAVFLGAGVSYESGFPSWPQLITRLAEVLVPSNRVEAFQLLAAYASPLVLARFLRDQVGVRSLFASRLHEALYGPDVDYARPNATLDFAVSLAVRAQAANAPLKFATYNFDDLLEARLAAEIPRISFQPVWDEVSRHGAGVPILIQHVHGYLPREPEGSPETWLEPILAEDGFNVLMSDPNSWVNRVQLEALSFDTCLFVGLSMTDPNLRRLLDIARPSARNREPSRFILARAHAEGDRIVPGAPPMSAQAAEELNEMEATIADGLGAVRLPLASYGSVAELTELLRMPS